MLRLMRIPVHALMLTLFLVCSAEAACPEGDLSGDCEVNLPDLQLFAEQWLGGGCTGSGCADLDGDSIVEMGDFARLADKWHQKGIALIVNEFMASNGTTLQSVYYRDGQWHYEYPDWIEIHNCSGVAQNIGGMYLTDDLNEPAKWQIPAGITIGRGNYWVVFASGKSEPLVDFFGYHHTNFKLDADGEEVVLVDRDGNTPVDGIMYGDQSGDISFGRYPDASEDWRYLGTPSPGGENNGAYEDEVDGVAVSRNRGFYDAPFTVIITCDTPGATIYYSVDGIEPGKSGGRFPTGIKYTGPITISQTTCLRARAIKTGWKPSPIDTHTYIFVQDVKTQSPNGERPGTGWPASGYFNGQMIDYGMDPDIVYDPAYAGYIDQALLSLPTMSLVTEVDNLFDEEIGIYVHAGSEGRLWERPASLELIYPPNPEGPGFPDLVEVPDGQGGTRWELPRDMQGGFQADCGIRIRGGYSRSGSNPKHAFRVLFRSGYGPTSLNYPLFGDEGVDEFRAFDLRTCQNYSWAFDGSSQNTLVREVWSRDTQGQMSSPYYTRSRYYHLYINGHYWGIYQTQERSEANWAASYMGGDADDYDVLHSDWTVGREMSPTDGNTTAYRRLYDAAMAGFSSNSAYFRVQGLNADGTPNPSYEKMLDVDHLADFMILEYYTGDRDGPGSRFGNIPNNTWVVYNRRNPNGWKFPHHDNEHTLGTSNTEENMVTPYTSAGSQWRYFNQHWLHERLATQNAEYRMKFADRVQKHFFNDGLLTRDVARARFDNRAAQIDLAIITHSARWGDAKRHPPFTRQDWLNELNNARNWMSDRVSRVLNQVKGQGWFPSLLLDDQPRCFRGDRWYQDA